MNQRSLSILALCAAALVDIAVSADARAASAEPRSSKTRPGAMATDSGADDEATRVARGHAKRGNEQFNIGKFEEALAAYEAAYAAKPTTIILFNIGLCHYHMHNYERAIFFFQGFLRGAPSHEKAAEARDYLKKAEDEQEQQKAIEPGLVGLNRRPSSAPEELRPATAPTVAAVEPPPPVYKRWWFWTIIGVAVVGGATAVTLYYTLPMDPVPQQGSTGLALDW